MKIFISNVLWFFIFGQISAQKWDKYAVFFAEHTLKMPIEPANVVRVFLDQNGNYYPVSTKEFIFDVKDKELKRNGPSLEDWYLKNQTSMQQLLQTITDSGKLNTAFINNYFAQHIAVKINEKAKLHDKLCILIHGFRKKAYGLTDNELSYTEYDEIEKSIAEKTNKKILFIEIYWDSKFIDLLSAGKHKGFELLEQSALPNAKKVSHGLRTLLSFIKKDSFTIISHSLGAAVVSDLLFKTEVEEMKPTPWQDIKVYLLAPAIGHERFIDYSNRTVLKENKDNYQFYIFYNTHDFVLKKSLHWKNVINIDYLPTSFGNTSLGCNYNHDRDSLELLFNTKFINYNLPIFEDLSLNNENQALSCHHFHCYFRHNRFNALIENW